MPRVAACRKYYITLWMTDNKYEHYWKTVKRGISDFRYINAIPK